MNLTVKSDYAFRTLMFLAVRDPENATIQEIAARYGISRGHVMVLVHQLGSIGFLQTRRGRSGGIKLAIPAAKIWLGEVARAIEPHFNMVECFNRQTNTCVITGSCRLHDVLAEATAAWMCILDKYTLDDLVKDNSGLVELLRMPMEPHVHRGIRPKA
jgi:Rrf2 family transcriptional regulator, nitric oxide-sensitive transcriptional repressor